MTTTKPNTHAPWLDADGRFFSAAPEVAVLDTGNGGRCVVVDNVLANPQGLRTWAAAQRWHVPQGYPYPGHVSPVPDDWKPRISDGFNLHVRAHLGARRVLDSTTRLSLIDTAESELSPVQWLCHRDRLPDAAGELLFAASVLYLFDNPALGGTSFYKPTRSAAETDALVADSQQIAAREFAAHYGLQPGYMNGSNLYFERTAQVPAAWNRLIVYDGSLFHSADVHPARLNADPLKGRLTLNSFITCRRTSR
jgi:hypothetical protein